MADNAAQDTLVAALVASDGFPVPTLQEFAERVLEQLDRLGYEVRRKTPDLTSVSVQVAGPPLGDQTEG